MKKQTFPGLDFSGLLMLNILFAPSPEHKEISKYKGLTAGEIRQAFNVSAELPTDDPDTFVIEARLPDGTLSFEINCNICVNAFLFSDN